MYVVPDEAGRICASSEEDCLVGAVFADAPEGFFSEKQHEWRLVDGTLVHEPQENEPENETENETPTQEARIAALEESSALLTQCLLEMSEIIYA